MTLLSIFIGTGVAVIGLIVYSALIVSGRQERIAQRVREENRFERAPYSTGSGSLYSAGGFAFETSEELSDLDEVDEVDNPNDLYDDVFNFEKYKSMRNR